MYTSNDLSLSMFYSSAIAEESGNKVATLTVQTMGSSAEILQISKLHCITNENKMKSYSIGEQFIANGSDPLLAAIETWWRDNSSVLIEELMIEVMDFVLSNVNQNATWIGQYGMKIFDNEPVAKRIPDSVLQSGSATHS
ncbi:MULTISPECIES: hypothetical protein [Klebsiella]|uniref:hypothetical protein n=1 Tax=Klebsiella TaxID=570 RepID=UPI0015EA3142|nr:MULTISPECIES: hypothetical protein [Klebsiella]MBW5975388.1 hypothetical protein [Klebsiella michiganensis]MBE8895613.1 hypothetical protein [Klebsiella grimontii]MBW6012557.1 hypothetical protein [Klebsiella sp. CVUAS 11263]MBW6033830.1 hypothetical protein [Klebsiella sp. CVUAS 11332]QLT88516.1 hypothetical protein HV252_14695 [Klebsiella grimontii]